MGCHFLLQCMQVKSESEVAQSCPTLSDPMDCSLPGSSTHGIFQARVLEWVTIAVSVYTGRRILHYCAIWEAHTLTQFPIMVTSCKTVAQYHIQDVYTNSVKTKHFYQLQGPSCCPFITTPTSFQPGLHPTYFSESLTMTNLLSSYVIRLFHKCYINGIIGYAAFWNFCCCCCCLA